MKKKDSQSNVRPRCEMLYIHERNSTDGNTPPLELVRAALGTSSWPLLWGFVQ